jgi:uncharacterized protein YjdB
VTAKATPLKKFTVAKAPKAMKLGKAAQLKIKLTPTAATNLKVSFKSSKKAVATVDKAGTITAITKGKAKITVKVGSKKTVITVTVK